jgi:transcriptional regulator with XRE-family HTH domain
MIVSSRKQQQLSREALSGLAGVSVSFVRDAELDPSSCSFGKLHRLCAALGLDWQLHKNGELQWPQAITDVRLPRQPGNAFATGVNRSKDSP